MVYGVIESYDVYEWRVKSSVFRFKFELKGYAINFCVKYNISFDNIYFYGIARIMRL